MKQHELRAPEGARRKSRRVGRGDGSGRGSYSGRGIKGQKSRSGEMKARPGFEGGQLPLAVRLPTKRGFANIFHKEYQEVNVGRLAVFPPGFQVDPAQLLEKGLIKELKLLVKILGEGEMRGPLTVRAHRFTASARRKIEEAGGRVEEMALVRRGIATGS
ncbi:MAG: 50S ribosomal protein L15 [Chloroflexi bacterium]|nr:50S ribosomal protein L15 [Chloroflexota bacterium]